MKIEVVKQNWCQANGIGSEYLVLVDKKARYKGNKEEIEAFLRGLYGN